ncbi:2OG-Fe dioxygenase family protein [Streptomyces sp. NPDC059982]|uniref:2OG-Fe dioxygenase family protein n=1 Tax=unclassified Streptomyces TaxID=2593676 RepID=UPI003683717D
MSDSADGEPGPRVVALSWLDNAGISRVKAVPAHRLEHANRWGVGMAPVFDTCLVDDSRAGGPGFDGPVGDLRLRPDLTRLTPLAAQPGWAWAPADRCGQDGTPYEGCQRSFALRMTREAQVRDFAPFRAREAGNPFFRVLVHHNAATFDRCAGQAPPSWEVDAHLIRVTARAGARGEPSPEGRHRDGFDYIALHHVGRANVTGGRTTLYTAEDGPPLATTTFSLPLDSLYAQDARILHDVTPVSVAVPAAHGHRDMLLMSFKAREATG